MKRGLLLLLAALLAGCGGGGDAPPVTGPVPPPVAAAGAADPGGDERAALRLPPDGRRFGFSSYLRGTERTPPRPDAARTAADVAATGANAHRVTLPWSAVEPRRGIIDRATLLAPTRAFADRVEARGIRLVLVLGGTPEWAAARPGDRTSAPRAGADVDEAFAAYAALVARTFPEALAIETWNEPNATFAFTPQDGAAERYALLHRAAAAAIRSAAPEVDVLLGGLAATDSGTDEVTRPQAFLKRMYAAGLTPEDYDALAVHAYPGQDDGRMRSLGAGSEFAAALADFRAGFRWRDPRANVWVTETGVTTTGPEPVSPAAQADGEARLVRKLLSTRDVAAVFLHTLYDREDVGEDDPERGYGVRTASGRPKPALCRIEELRSAADPGAPCR